MKQIYKIGFCVNSPLLGKIKLKNNIFFYWSGILGEKGYPGLPGQNGRSIKGDYGEDGLTGAIFNNNKRYFCFVEKQNFYFNL